MFGCASGLSKSMPTGHLGASAYLKRSFGAVCSSAGIYYNPAPIITHQRFAFKGTCPSGQLSGGGTGYVYNGGGYSSKAVQAPYQNY